MDPESTDDWLTEGIRNAGQERRPDRIKADIVEAKAFGENSFEAGLFLPLFDALQEVELDNSRNGALGKVKDLLPDVRSHIEMEEQHRPGPTRARASCSLSRETF